MRCCETVWTKKDWHQCTRNAVTEHEGKPYCKQHDPSEIRARRTVANTEWMIRQIAESAKPDPLSVAKELEK